MKTYHTLHRELTAQLEKYHDKNEHNINPPLCHTILHQLNCIEYMHTEAHGILFTYITAYKNGKQNGDDIYVIEVDYKLFDQMHKISFESRKRVDEQSGDYTYILRER